MTDNTLATVRDLLYKCVEMLYLDDPHDPSAQEMAGFLITLYDAINIELLERAYNEQA